MKRIISIVLTAILIVSATGMLAHAAESEFKSQEFLDSFLDSKTLEFKLSNEVISSDVIDVNDIDMRAAWKCIPQDDGNFQIKLVATIKLGWFKIKAFVSDDAEYIYVPLFGMKITPDELGLGNIYEELLDTIDMPVMIDLVSNDDLKYFKFRLDSSEEQTDDKYGEVVVENVSIDVISTLKEFEKQGEVIFPEGLEWENMTSEELIDCPEIDQNTRNLIAELQGFNAKVTFDDDAIVSLILTLASVDGNFTSIRQGELIERYLEWVKTDVSESAFKEPFFAFDFTFIFKWLMSIAAE